MVAPHGVLWRLAGTAHVAVIVLRGDLFCTATEHADDAQAHGLHRQGRRPVLVQDIETYVAVAEGEEMVLSVSQVQASDGGCDTTPVDVWMHGHAADKDDLLSEGEGGGRDMNQVSAYTTYTAGIYLWGFKRVAVIECNLQCVRLAFVQSTLGPREVYLPSAERGSG